MAKFIDKKLLEEYETTFRLCSRFSHPSILGDQEYIVQDDHCLIFSPLPSPIGIVPNLKNAIKYMIEFLDLIDEIYALEFKQSLTELKLRFEIISNMEKYQKDLSSPERPSSNPSSIKESIIVFDTNPHSLPTDH